MNESPTLDLDYMVSLKLTIEDEYNVDDDNMIILELINYLRDMHIPNNQIKNAMYLLYDSIDPSKKEIIDQLLIPNTLSNIFASLLANTNNTIEEQTDLFTGDMINPANIINMFSYNPNYNFQISFDVNNLPHLTYIANIFDIPRNNTTEDILDKNTKILEYKELDENLRTKYSTCFICLADFGLEDIIRKIPCEHIFHKDCIDPWLLKESYKCPVCRGELT